MNDSGIIILYFIIIKTKEFEIIITIVIYSILWFFFAFWFCLFSYVNDLFIFNLVITLCV